MISEITPFSGSTHTAGFRTQRGYLLGHIPSSLLCTGQQDRGLALQEEENKENEAARLQRGDFLLSGIKTSSQPYYCA
jgi:hypothetical protein